MYYYPSVSRGRADPRLRGAGRRNRALPARRQRQSLDSPATHLSRFAWRAGNSARSRLLGGLQPRRQTGPMSASRRLHNSALRESAEKKRRTPIAETNPSCRHATLALSNQCLPRRFGVPPPPRDCSTGRRFEFCSPVRRPPPRPAATGSAPPPSAEYRLLL